MISASAGAVRPSYDQQAMSHHRQIILCLCGLLWAGVPATAQTDEVLDQLNSNDTVKGTEQSKSYRTLFDAYLDLSPPPAEVGPRFDLNTISPTMPNWASVSDWAESNPEMAEAILGCIATNIIGLPYGIDQVESNYREAGLVAAVGVQGSLHATDFPYLHAMDVIGAYATAEVYRRFEARDAQAALDLSVAYLWVLRQLCDRQFLQEKLVGVQLLIDALANVRDTFYRYQGEGGITAEQFRQLAWYDLPQLRPDRNRLHIPEGDRLIAQALLEEVFDARTDQADPEKFADAFAAIQSADAPLTRFGAARRWRMIAMVHGSLEASTDRLKLIYDDWWRRWRVQEYDAILATKTQFERTNPVRYAAVIYSMQDIEDVFTIRNQLIASVNGTAVAAGLCAYRTTFGVFPDDKKQAYGQFIRKRISDVDPYDEDFGRLGYRRLGRSGSIDTLYGRLQVDAGQCLLYSRGPDHQNDRGARHSLVGAEGSDYVLWPPMKALARELGKIQ